MPRIEKGPSPVGPKKPEMDEDPLERRMRRDIAGAHARQEEIDKAKAAETSLDNSEYFFDEDAKLAQAKDTESLRTAKTDKKDSKDVVEDSGLELPEEDHDFNIEKDDTHIDATATEKREENMDQSSLELPEEGYDFESGKNGEDASSKRKAA